MKRLSLIAFALATPLAVLADTTVFSDNFTGASTVQSAAPGAPTASSTDYEVFIQGAAPGASGSVYSIAANNLIFGTPTTAGALGEVAARFPTVALANIGDHVNLTLTFVDTASVLIAGMNANSSVNIGLFNSGGVNLNQGVRLDGTQITGGSQTYLGYAGRLFLNGNASGFNRNTQAIGTSTTSQNQDLLFNNASSSAAFNSPTGTGFTSTSGGTTGFTTGLTAGSTYTFSYTITLTAANAVQVNNQLFAGSTATGTPLINFTGTSTSGAFLGSTFDSLGFGYRANNAPGGAITPSLDIIQIDVLTNVPEPSILAISGLGILALGAVRRGKRKS
jgi:hypothetical protein